jgi:hypothetical protein
MTPVSVPPKPGNRTSPRRRACPGLDPGPGPKFAAYGLGPGLRRDDDDASTSAAYTGYGSNAS